MSAHSYVHGNPVTWDEQKGWCYEDGVPSAGNPRPCPRCGAMSTPAGHDACLGQLPGVKGACCGHGVKEPYVIRSGFLAALQHSWRFRIRFWMLERAKRWHS